MDDLCLERGADGRGSEYFYVHVGIPGGPAVVSQYYRAVVRIDDNDREHRRC